MDAEMAEPRNDIEKCDQRSGGLLTLRGGGTVSTYRLWKAQAQARSLWCLSNLSKSKAVSNRLDVELQLISKSRLNDFVVIR